MARRPLQPATWALAAIAASVLLAGCGERPAPPHPAILEPPKADGARALAEVERLLELSPRVSGTDNARRAAEHIAERLKIHGVGAIVDTFTDRVAEGEMEFHNVVGTLPGRSGRFVILGSHFDTKHGMSEAFTGANDSGSSTGLLIELARVLAEEPMGELGVVFAFFDGEESRHRYGPLDGLHGSRHMARTLREEGRVDKVRAMILLDMVGDRDITITLPRNSSTELVSRVFAAASAEGARDTFRLAPYEILDDHVPFMREGIAAIDLIDFEFGSAPGLNDYWHTEEDTIDKLSAESLATIGNVTLRVLYGLQAGE